MKKHTVVSIIVLCTIGLVCFCVIKVVMHKSSVSSSDYVAEKTDAGVFPEVDKAIKNFTTKGNWTFIPTNYRNFYLRFDFSSVPEIFDRFEKEQNLVVKDWKIVYNPYDSYPHGFIIHHAPK